MKETPCPSETASGQPSIQSCFGKSAASQSTAVAFTNSVTDAEILWTLYIVKKHSSYRSCISDMEVFSSMFPDSEIERKMKLGKQNACI